MEQVSKYIFLVEEGAEYETHFNSTQYVNYSDFLSIGTEGSSKKVRLYAKTLINTFKERTVLGTKKC